MKCVTALLLAAVACALSSVAEADDTQNGRLLNVLRPVRSPQQGGVNYGFPTFPDFGSQFPQAGQMNGGLFSRSDFSDFMPDPTQFKGGQGWTTRSCVYDEKGKQKCVEQRGDKPKN